MPNYDKIWAILAGRAVEQGGINATSFIEQARASGMSDETILNMLEEDLETGGQVFGPFLRAIEGAAQSAVMTSIRQGETIGTIDGDEELRRLVGLAESEDAIEEAIRTGDPNLAEALEEVAADDLLETSIAELRNTCHVCLPLHGKTLTRREWQERGLLPEMRHAGWKSSCKCRLIPAKYADSDDLVAPLVRERAESPRGLKPSKRTTAVISQGSIERAQRVRDEALATPEGRRTLRLLGQQERNS